MAASGEGQRGSREHGISAYGVEVVVRASEGFRAELGTALLPGMALGPPSPAAVAAYAATLQEGRWSVCRDGARIALHAAPSAVVEVLVQDVERVVAAHARDPVFIHAGAVAIAGQGVVVPGRSGAGKSTLVAALLRVGATYLSDEFALLDERGHVHPYPRPLRVAGVPPGAFAVSPSAVPIRLIVITSFSDSGEWRPRAAPPRDVVLALLGNAVGARTRHAEVLRCVVSAAGAAKGVKSPRGEAAAAARWITRVVDRALPGPVGGGSLPTTT